MVGIIPFGLIDSMLLPFNWHCPAFAIRIHLSWQKNGVLRCKSRILYIGKSQTYGILILKHRVFINSALLLVHYSGWNKFFSSGQLFQWITHIQVSSEGQFWKFAPSSCPVKLSYFHINLLILLIKLIFTRANLMSKKIQKILANFASICQICQHLFSWKNEGPKARETKC